MTEVYLQTRLTAAEDAPPSGAPVLLPRPLASSPGDAATTTGGAGVTAGGSAITDCRLASYSAFVSAFSVSALHDRLVRGGGEGRVALGFAAGQALSFGASLLEAQDGVPTSWWSSVALR